MADEQAAPPPTTESAPADPMAKALAIAERIHAKPTDTPQDEPQTEAPKGDAPPADTKDAPPAEAPKDAPAEAKEEAKPEEEGSLAKNLAAIQRAKKRSEAELAKQRAELEKEKAAIAELKAKAEAFEQARAAAKADPIAFLQSLGFDDKDIEAASRLGYGHILKDQAPKDVQEFKTRRALELKLEQQAKELAELRQSIEQRETQRAQEQAFHAYRSSVAGQLKSLDDKRPLAKAMYESDPDGVTEEVIDIARHVARHRLAEDPGAAPPTPEELADLYERVLEKRAEPFKKIFAPQAQAAQKPQPQTADEQKPATRTLTNANTATPTAPRPPALTDEERLQRAMEIARTRLVGLQR